MNDAEKRAKEAAKELRQARFLVKWSPVFWFIALALSGFAVDQCLAKPGVVSYLRLLVPIGTFIFIAGYVQQAKARLRDEDPGASRAYSIAGMLLAFGGSGLADMYKRGHGTVFSFSGAAILVVLALCGILMWQEHKEVRNKRSRLAALRAAANNPTQPPTEPAP